MVRAPRRAGRRDEQVAKLDRAQAGAAAQLPARDLLRGHGESFRVRVRGMPGVPVASARAEAGWEPPRSPASARRSPEPRAAESRRGRLVRPALRGAPGPVRSLVGLCLLSSLQLLPNPTGESRESKLAPRSGRRGVRRAREPGVVGAGGMGAGRSEPAGGSGCPRGARSGVHRSGPARSQRLGPRGRGPGRRVRGRNHTGT